MSMAARWRPAAIIVLRGTTGRTCRSFPTKHNGGAQRERVHDRAHDRRQCWTMPPRPQWLAEFNELGHVMSIRSIVPLDEESLLAEVTRNTGFGGFRWGDKGVSISAPPPP